MENSGGDTSDSKECESVELYPALYIKNFALHRIPVFENHK